MGRIIIEGKVHDFTNKEIARVLGFHPNTIYNALSQGESHQYYKKIITAIVNKNKDVKVL